MTLAEELAPGAVLVAYRFLRQDEARLRSSVWREESGAWRMVFHQATASP